ncbi:hypothetical protein G6F24_016694 [Rhizopus arrhizus]|nr:hypothetical protein G6F24_016694 [Rhizopus arrhizus]
MFWPSRTIDAWLLHALRNAILAIGPGLVVLPGHHFTAAIHLHVAHDRHGEIADVLAEQADTGHGARLEVPFQAEIVLRGLEGLQLLVAALTRPARIGRTARHAAIVAVLCAVVAQRPRGCDIRVARTGDHLRRGAAQHQRVRSTPISA